MGIGFVLGHASRCMACESARSFTVGLRPVFPERVAFELSAVTEREYIIVSYIRVGTGKIRTVHPPCGS